MTSAVVTVSATLSTVAALACLLVARTWVRLAREHRTTLAHLRDVSDTAQSWVDSLVEERRRWEEERRRRNGD